MLEFPECYLGRWFPSQTIFRTTDLFEVPTCPMHSITKNVSFVNLLSTVAALPHLLKFELLYAYTYSTTTSASVLLFLSYLNLRFVLEVYLHFKDLQFQSDSGSIWYRLDTDFIIGLLKN